MCFHPVHILPARRLVGFLKGVSVNLLKSPRHGGLDVFHSSKMLSFQAGFAPGKQKEDCQSQVRAVKVLGQSCYVVLGQDLPHAHQHMTRRIVVVEYAGSSDLLSDPVDRLFNLSSTSTHCRSRELNICPFLYIFLRISPKRCLYL